MHALAVYVVGFKFSTVVDCQTLASKMTDCNTNGMNFNEGNNEQPCVPDAHGFSSLTVNSSQKRQEVEEMVFSERYFETRGPTVQITHSKIISSYGTIQEKAPQTTIPTRFTLAI